MRRMVYKTFWAAVIISLSGLAFITSPAVAKDFWAVYGEQLVYNYAVKAGTGASLDFNKRLSSDEILAVATKSFSGSFTTRVTQIAQNNPGVMVACAFSGEAERCFVNSVMGSIFDEIHVVNGPQFSQRFINKMQNMYSSTFFKRNSLSARQERAKLVPPWKKFNPMFGFDMGDFELVVSTPFYTFGNIYVEPQYGVRTGFTLSFVKDRWYLDLFEDSLSLSYKFPKHMNKRGFTSITIDADWNVSIDNTFLTW